MAVSTLPSDVQRLIFEIAASNYRGMAQRLAILSHQIREWIDLVLYEEVVLRRDSTTRAFLYTIENASKPSSFFETHVKSLCISVDLRDSNAALKIVATCRGVLFLSLWVVSPSHTSIESPIVQSSYDIEAVLTQIRPKRTVIHVPQLLRSPDRQFIHTFFANVTHLTVVNNWEDWAFWSGIELLPSLTHLSFDVRVGPRGLYDSQMRLISAMTMSILENCPNLQVSVLVLLFDQLPLSTMYGIKGADRFDHRLVFVQKKEPFGGREAHTQHSFSFWQQAEETVRLQQSTLEHILVDV